MFKLLLVLSVFGLSQARTPTEIKQFMLSQSIECTKENVVSSKEMQMLINHELPDSKESKCFIACVFKKVDWMNAKGLFDLDAANKFADEEYVDDASQKDKAKKLFDTCKTVNDETPADGEAGCDRANNLARCLIDNAPKMGFHVQLGPEAM